ncbi:MAG: hypothetical protein C0504_04440 [Candidatus Solibacter sp.]|nr:hypothetical protein [Candidatus Solibacter sp.]
MALAPAVLAAQPPRKPEPSAAGKMRFLDRATEFAVTRLTSPDEESRLPLSPGRGISRRGDAALAIRRRDDRRQLIWLEFGSGAGRVLAESPGFDPLTAALTSDDRWILAADGARLIALQRQNPRLSTVAELDPAKPLCAPLAPSADRVTVFFAQSSGAGSEIHSLRIGQDRRLPHHECGEPVEELAPNPRRALVAWRTRSGAVWAGGLDGSRPRRIEMPEGRVLQFYWAAGGQAILYLFEPADPAKLVEIREQQVDSRTDSLVAKTSQFASFAPNADASAFVGASRSKASPHILLLLRKTMRELTLCEHGEQDAAACRPVFTPDSQSVVFTSAMHGKPALYLAGVEKLIEKTPG